MSGVVTELTPAPTVVAALRAFATAADVLLLDSAAVGDKLGRYSFLMADPIARFEQSQPVFGVDPFAAMRTALESCTMEPLPELPPFQGGIAGCLTYELGQCWEKFPSAPIDDLRIPVLHAGLYPWVIAWDHRTGQAWIIAQDWALGEESPSSDRAAQRAQAVLDRLQSPPDDTEPVWSRNTVHEPLPTWAKPVRPNLWSDQSPDEYLRAVERVIEYIYAGDIFQANMSQRLLARSPCGPVELYEQLRTCNPAPFAGLMLADDWAIVSASPERYVQIADGVVSTRPIKGTRRRSPQPEADLFTKDSLRESDKDQAENVMIVDLLRNDLSRVCRPGTVRVPQLCEVESYATVQHLVSEVQGTLEPGRTAWDVFAATFPGGSITGAPKVRAMEIIAELERTVRGPYTGCFFYVGADGRVDSNLLIRTWVQRRGWLQCGVGGGIVAQSSAQSEYEETWHKAAAMLAALT
ncbi:MAG: anthranilate synthase component I family protein [Planctomycetaceae bacterium]|nr:anthranilate synthase component I family protein [Planctomycetaceae bacterium]